MTHVWVGEYDPSQSSHEMVAYAAHEPDGGARPTVIIRRSLAVDLGEPLRLTFTISPDPNLER